MRIRSLDIPDIPGWIGLRNELWPDQSRAALDAEGRALLVAQPPLVVFVAEDSDVLAGFIEISLRSVAEGCTSSPVPYVEGWYVKDGWRRRGTGRALMRAAEEWSRTHGYTEIGSDTGEANRLSRTTHTALGFTEVETLVIFRKTL